MSISHVLSRTAAAAALVLALPALAAVLKTDPAKSSVSAVFKQMNVPVEAKFKKFTAQIDYDAAKPEAAKAAIDIDVPSFDLGDAEYNKEVQKKEWFNGAQFPKASFVSTALKPAAGGKLDVVGKLTIKGKTADVAFPLSVKKEGTTQVFEGALPIKRLAFNIGEGEWKDTSMVADEVVIKFRVVAAQ
ncbi:YceI family protein [Noviherbaspirillum aerium]|uniref:YceI family protein n=1 Tax=Noviherbaspirillum aerium TaxID=2588497 RepID=UPI00124F5B6F|nr:YceI family protein [Noviherbaspirillum aerium]